MDGAIVVDKPEGWTSHDVVNRVRRLANTRKVGHLGTLDPVATGVLPVVINRATRLAQFYTRSDKVYEAVVRFGFSTDTYDRTGTPTLPFSEPAVDGRDLARHLERFRGEFLQAPPPVSAKKVSGERAYRLARRQVALDLPPVPVHVYSLELISLQDAEATLRVHCSGGTYIRSIAHELGQALRCGAHLRDLRRTSSGEFEISQAHTLDYLAELTVEQRLAEAVIPAARLLPSFPAVYVDDVTIGHIRQGRNFPVSPFRVCQGTRYVKAISRDDELIAIGEAYLPNVYHPAVVL